MIIKNNPPSKPEEPQIAPPWFVEFDKNLDKKFESINKKLDEHTKDFDVFKSKQEVFSKKLLECPIIATEFNSSKNQ
ncbi:hypothetical protein [Mycoplasma todarodis]|uniref:hypothetical protein n=1 Tax=Mycoplasma todarodis TaxID=1937191 RepID=UPI003B50CA98